MLIALTLIFNKLGISFKLEPAIIPVKFTKKTDERLSII